MVENPNDVARRLAEMGAEEARILAMLRKVHSLRCRLLRKAYRDHGATLGLDPDVDPDVIEPKVLDEGEQP